MFGIFLRVTLLRSSWLRVTIETRSRCPAQQPCRRVHHADVLLRSGRDLRLHPVAVVGKSCVGVPRVLSAGPDDRPLCL